MMMADDALFETKLFASTVSDNLGSRRRSDPDVDGRPTIPTQTTFRMATIRDEEESNLGSTSRYFGLPSFLMSAHSLQGDSNVCASRGKLGAFGNVYFQWQCVTKRPRQCLVDLND